MNLNKVTPNIMKYLNKEKPYIQANEDAHQGLSVPQLVFEHGRISSKLTSMPNIGKYMIGCMHEMKKSYRELYKQPSEANLHIAEHDLSEMETLAYSLGASNIAYTPVNPSNIFRDKVILYPNAIVFAMEMEHSKIETAPSKICEKEIFRSYYTLNKLVNRVKDFLNSKGYQAVAGPALGGEANYPVLAQKAGLGFIGQHGILITKEFGPSIRLAVVYTNINNLPIAKKDEHDWIHDFCQTCKRCVAKCPADAIYNDPIIFSDGSKECIDYKRCALPFSTQRGCTVCIKECVFFKHDYEKIKRSFLRGEL